MGTLQAIGAEHTTLDSSLGWYPRGRLSYGPEGNLSELLCEAEFSCFQKELAVSYKVN